MGGAHLEVVIAVFDTEGDSIGFSRWCLLDWDLTNCVSRTVVRILIAIRRVSWNVVWEHRVSFTYISRLRGRYAICCDNPKLRCNQTVLGRKNQIERLDSLSVNCFVHKLFFLISRIFSVQNNKIVTNIFIIEMCSSRFNFRYYNIN